MFASLQGQEIVELSEFQNPDHSSYDMFGISVGANDSLLIVGAYGEDEDTANSNTVSSAGSAYIYRKIGEDWVFYQKIIAPDRHIDDSFGMSVDISDDYAVVSATRNDFNENYTDSVSDAGAVYIFHNNNGHWAFIRKIVAPARTQSQNFGENVKIEGDFLFIGCSKNPYDISESNYLNWAGAVFVYHFDGTDWNFFQKITAPVRSASSLFGSSICFSGNYLFLGSYLDRYDVNGLNAVNGAGSAYIFERDSGAFTFVQKVVAPDRNAYNRFGNSIAGDSSFMVVGSFTDDFNNNGTDSLFDAGSAYIFRNVSGVWMYDEKISAPDRRKGDQYGEKLGVSDNSLIVTAYRQCFDQYGNDSLLMAGAIYYYYFDGSNWSYVQKFTPSDRGFGNYFGNNIDMDHGLAFVTASNASKTYVLAVDENTYLQPVDQHVCNSSDAEFSFNSDAFVSFQWQKYHAPGWIDLTDTTVYQNIHSDTLKIASPHYSLNGNLYRCRAFNGVYTRISDAATLLVDTFVVADAGNDTMACSAGNFQLNASESQPNSGYWISGNAGVSFSDSSACNTMVNGLFYGSNIFTWIVNNGLCGMDSSDVTVLYPADSLQILQNPVSQNFSLNDTVLLYVSATGYAAEYQWYKDGMPLSDNPHISGATTDSLRLLLTTVNDTGAYFCMVFNPCDVVVSDTASLELITSGFARFSGSVTVFPNPASGVITISAGNDMGNIISVEITDILGNTMMEKRDFSDPVMADISSFCPGVYFVRVFTAKGSYVSEIIKK
jgi:hypothetical protein